MSENGEKRRRPGRIFCGTTTGTEHLLERIAMNSQPRCLQIDRLETPIGAALLATDEQGVLRALDFHDYESRMLSLLRRHYASTPLSAGSAPDTARAALTRYFFEGELTDLARIEWAAAGTPFQRSVWNALLAIPPGETRSYGELACLLGRPTASRAVGWAIGSNPIAIVVPCHRVIGASGKLTGYASGLHRKHWLLQHEASFAASPADFSGCLRDSRGENSSTRGRVCIDL
jgi:methylated-DNA-[protein]-cysteine S-methyltransferase